MTTIAPFFMFGFERSGTTLLSMIVGAHPDIAVPLSVTGMWFRFGSKLDEYNRLETREDVERIVDDLLGEERIQLWDVTLDRSELLATIEPGAYGNVVAGFHSAYARAKGKRHWACLDIANLDGMAEVNRWFPDARFLHIVRDGRDVALSHETMPYGASNTLEAAEKWRHRLTVSLKMGEIMGTSRYRVVRYEDLILETAKALEDICSFIGLPYDAEMLNYPDMVDEKVPDDRRWLWPALNKPPDKSKVGRWKREMSERKRIVFEGNAGDMLAHFGYETYERVPRSVTAILYETWCFLGRGGRFRRLARKLGVSGKSKLEREWSKSGG